VIGPAAKKTTCKGCWPGPGTSVASGSQIMNCTFRDIYSTAKLAMVFDLYLFTPIYVTESLFYNIQTKAFWKNQYSQLYMDKSTVSYLGLHLLNVLPAERKGYLVDFLKANQTKMMTPY
jgi:hypothetical protein